MSQQKWVYMFFWKNLITFSIDISEKRKFVKICVQNQWGVLHTFISKSGRVANLRILHKKD